MHLPLLRDLSDAEYRAALKHMEVCHWAAGDLVLEQGAQSEALYLLVAGSLQLGRGHMHVGSWFGETGALFGGRMQAAVVALETAVCVVFPQKCLEQLPAHLLTSLRAAHPEGAEGASATSAGLAGPELDEDEIEIRRCVAEISSPSQLELIRELGKGAPLPCYTPSPTTTRAPLDVPHPLVRRLCKRLPRHLCSEGRPHLPRQAPVCAQDPRPRAGRDGQAAGQRHQPNPNPNPNPNANPNPNPNPNPYPLPQVLPCAAALPSGVIHCDLNDQVTLTLTLALALTPTLTLTLTLTLTRSPRRTLTEEEEGEARRTPKLRSPSGAPEPRTPRPRVPRTRRQRVRRSHTGLEPQTSRGPQAEV